jgi:hypothetical protein
MTLDKDERRYVKCELYFATNYWLRNEKRSHMARMNSDRKPAIQALHNRVKIYLSKDFGCLVSTYTLNAALDDYFGRDMDEKKRIYDLVKGTDKLNYIDDANAAKRDKFRLRFRRGILGGYARAYRVPWMKAVDGKNPKPILANSADVGKQSALKFMLEGGWTFFVMSRERDIYMVPHSVMMKGGLYFKDAPVFHSSILAGGTVACAGTILIKKGIILGLRIDSGHYRPTNSHMVSVLEHLKTVDVDIRNIDIYATFAGVVAATGSAGLSLRKQFKVDPSYAVPYCKGDEFLQALGNWKMIVERERRRDSRRRKWEGKVQGDFMDGIKSFKEIWKERYLSLVKANKKMKKTKLKEMAHLHTALALSEIHPKYWKKAH